LHRKASSERQKPFCVGGLRSNWNQCSPEVSLLVSRFLSRPIAGGLALWTPYTAVALFALLSLSRGVSLVANYGAPMHIYRALPQVMPAPPHNLGNSPKSACSCLQSAVHAVDVGVLLVIVNL